MWPKYSCESRARSIAIEKIGFKAAGVRIVCGAAPNGCRWPVSLPGKGTMPATGLTPVMRFPDPSALGSRRQACLGARVGRRNIASLRRCEPSMTPLKLLESPRHTKSFLPGRKESICSRSSVVPSTFLHGVSGGPVSESAMP